jgi:uncharacterized delta-60 repeat protein
MKTTLLKLTAAWPLAIFLLLPALAPAKTPVQSWVQPYHGPGTGDDNAAAVVMDGGNNVIVTGHSDGGGSTYDYATIQYSSAGVPLWTNRYNGPGNSVDVAQAAAVDRNNDVVVTGYSTGTNSYYDYATIKYSSAGVPLWTNRYNGPANDWDKASAVAADSSNNVIVTGYSIGSGSAADYATIKYSSAGVPLWTNRYNGPGNSGDYASAVAVDGSNNVIVTGSSWGSGSSYDYATIKYSSAGVPLWTNRYNGPGSYDDQAFALAVDGSNSVVVTGYAWYGSSYDYATVKYSSAGVPLWTNRYNGPGNGNDWAAAVAVDGSNGVIVTGYSTNSATGYDYATVKYSSAGVPLWTNRFNGPGNSSDYASAVAVDSSNNVVVTGYSYSSTNAGSSDYATIQYSSAGVPLWTNRFNGPGNGDDQASAVAVDRRGNIIIAGESVGSSGSYAFATVKYAFSGPPVLTGLNLASGAFQLRVDEVLQPGTLVIESSTNFAVWVPVLTNPTPTDVLFYTDPNAGSLPKRFYRAIQSP